MIKKFILSFLIVACFTVLLYTFILTPVNVSGASMLPTYHNNQKVWLYRLSQVKKGDVVIVLKDGETFIKRVVAGPGDELNILSDGTVIVNGEKLEETYVEEFSREPLSISLPYTIPEDCYFVMGDNRIVSFDSRSFGAVPREDILGVVF